MPHWTSTQYFLASGIHSFQLIIIIIIIIIITIITIVIVIIIVLLLLFCTDLESSKSNISNQIVEFFSKVIFSQK